MIELEDIHGVLCDISETLMQIRDLAQQAMAEVVDEALAEEAEALNTPTRES
jgi:hypothetical protein